MKDKAVQCIVNPLFVCASFLQTRKGGAHRLGLVSLAREVHVPLIEAHRGGGALPLFG